MGEEVVASALLELGGEGGGPVCAVGFEGVGEDGGGGRGAEGVEERLAYGFEVGGYGFVGEGVEDVALGSYGGALDLLPGVALDEEEGDAGLGCGGDGGGLPGEGEGASRWWGSRWRRGGRGVRGRGGRGLGWGCR